MSEKDNVDKIRIYFSEDTETMELICNQEKGYRWDVVVQINDKLFLPQYHTIWSLTNGFNASLKRRITYSIDPCLILVEEVKKENIIKATLDLHKTLNFFSNFQPVDDIDLSKMVIIYSGEVK